MTQKTLAFITLSLLSAFALNGCDSDSHGQEAPSLRFNDQVSLGEALFFDQNLSLGRTQSCATCHNDQHGFVDNRTDQSGNISAVSTGQDAVSKGTRNAPTAAYAAFSPDFHYGTRQRFNSNQGDYQGFLGGQFLDGRALDLEEQAGGPPLNPLEMAMPDKSSVVERLKENRDYVAAMQYLYGENLFENTDAAYEAMTESIAAFEMSEFLSPFDSKYDRALRGQAELSPKEALGKSLFFSKTFTNCATCHQLNRNNSLTETFTGYEYHNIGVPVNETLRDIGVVVDDGLFSNPAVDDLSTKGKFKVPTLRNVAVTAPYMHNGVFRNLETVIKFYDHYLAGSQFTLNPETGAPWSEPETPENISLTELQSGRAMSQEDVEAMVCFLRTLTDQRYEHLVESQGIECD